jgi:hypothetical protein
MGPHSNQMKGRGGGLLEYTGEPGEAGRAPAGAVGFTARASAVETASNGRQCQLDLAGCG